MDNNLQGGFIATIPMDAEEGTLEASPVVESAQIEQAEPTIEQVQTVEEEAGKEPQQQSAKEQAKKADLYHKQIIDLLEEKFRQVDANRMTKQELREWFDERPEFAEVANRSKRLKDKFRPLMESDEASRVNPEIAAKREGQIKEVSEEDVIDDDKPLAKKDLPSLLDSYFDSREEKLLAKMHDNERRKELESFAVQKGLKDEAVDRFSKLAEAIYKADSSLESYAEALQAAYEVMKPKKDNPSGLQGVRSSAVTLDNVESGIMDLSQKPMTIEL